MKIVFASWNCKDEKDYAFQNWHSPLEKIAHKLIVFDPREIYFKYGKKELNERFLRLIENEKPDVVFMTLVYDEFYIETLQKIREISPKTKTINFFSDDEWRFDNYSRYLGRYFDVSVTSYPPAYSKAKKLGLKNFMLVPYSCNTDIYKKSPEKKIYDVSFVGQPTKERIREIKYLIENGVRVGVWGKGWDKLEEFDFFRNSYMGIAQDFPKIINQSKMMLTFLMDDADERVQIKGRLTEVGGCGTFQIITENSYTKKMARPGKHVAYFSSSLDLKKKIDYYLKNESEREKAAERFRKEVVKNLNWDSAMTRMIKSNRHETRKKGASPDILIIGRDEIDIALEKINSSKAEYVVFDRHGIRIDRNLGEMLGGSRDSDLTIVDTMLEVGGQEILCARYHNPSKRVLSGSVIFRSSYLKKNKGAIETLRHNSINVEKKRASVIAYPFLKVSQMPLSEVSEIELDKKYEIAMFNLLYRHRYLAAIARSLKIFSIFARDGNLFILKTASGRKLPY